MAVPLPDIVAPPPSATVAVPPVTVSVVVRMSPSTSPTVTPAIARDTSSLVLCAPGKVWVGASFTGTTVTLTVAVSVTPPEVTV